VAGQCVRIPGATRKMMGKKISSFFNWGKKKRGEKKERERESWVT